MFSGLASSIISSVGGLIGGSIGAREDREFARAQSEADRAFQREVYQNQYQWKAADARKAGLHPLAVLGGGAYSASPSSMPASSSMADVLGKFGAGIGDAFASYKSRDDMAAEKAIAELREGQRFNSEQAEIQARTDMFSAQAEEARARAKSYTRPMATGREVIKGQTDSPPQRKKDETPYNDSYSVRNLGDGWFDINMSPDWQQEKGDELGQLYNFVRGFTRENETYWQEPKSGTWFKFNRDKGLWRKIDRGPVGDALDEARDRQERFNSRFGYLSSSWW